MRLNVLIYRARTVVYLSTELYGACKSSTAEEVSSTVKVSGRV